MMNFIFRKIVFFSLIILPFASSAPIVDESYTLNNQNRQDVYDAVINALFPIFFVFLTNVSGSSGKFRKILLPLLDDLLYNTVTWAIPLTVSFAYDDFLAIKIFSLVNMGLHVLCAAYALIINKKIGDVYDDILTDDGHLLYHIPLGFLIGFPVIVIPVFWIIYITTITHVFDSISILFITLFGILLISVLICFILWFYLEKRKWDYDYNVYLEYITLALMVLMFYAPNILQTLLIVL